MSRGLGDVYKRQSVKLVTFWAADREDKKQILIHTSVKLVTKTKH